MESLMDSARVMFAESMRAANVKTCSRWAEARRIMGSPFPGQFSFVHHPWTRAIHDSTSPSPFA